MNAARQYGVRQRRRKIGSDSTVGGLVSEVKAVANATTRLGGGMRGDVITAQRLHIVARQSIGHALLACQRQASSVLGGRQPLLDALSWCKIARERAKRRSAYMVSVSNSMTRIAGMSLSAHRPLANWPPRRNPTRAGGGNEAPAIQDSCWSYGYYRHTRI